MPKVNFIPGPYTNFYNMPPLRNFAIVGYPAKRLGTCDTQGVQGPQITTPHLLLTLY